jgi:hypothetical protein
VAEEALEIIEVVEVEESVEVEEAVENEILGIRFNPGNSAWQFCLVTPSGTFTRDNLTNSNFSYSGDASSLYFMPIGGGGNAMVNGRPFALKSGQYYLFTGRLNVTVSTMNPGSMGHWSVRIVASSVPVSGNGNNRPGSPCGEVINQPAGKNNSSNSQVDKSGNNQVNRTSTNANNRVNNSQADKSRNSQVSRTTNNSTNRNNTNTDKTTKSNSAKTVKGNSDKSDKGNSDKSDKSNSDKSDKSNSDKSDKSNSDSGTPERPNNRSRK